MEVTFLKILIILTGVIKENVSVFILITTKNMFFTGHFLLKVYGHTEFELPIKRLCYFVPLLRNKLMSKLTEIIYQNTSKFVGFSNNYI